MTNATLVPVLTDQFLEIECVVSKLKGEFRCVSVRHGYDKANDDQLMMRVLGDSTFEQTLQRYSELPQKLRTLFDLRAESRWCGVADSDEFGAPGVWFMVYARHPIVIHEFASLRQAPDQVHARFEFDRFVDRIARTLEYAILPTN